jgi:peptidoglycan/xylan/chitin deacetylase (PgdA/CDA1 family)
LCIEVKGQLNKERIAINQLFSQIKIKDKVTIGHDNRCTICINSGHFAAEKISFHSHPLTELFLKRNITSSQVQIFSTITKKSLLGKIIASYSDGKPAISLYENQLFFNFDPFLSFFNLSNELSRKIHSDRIKWLLKLHRHTPFFISHPIRRVIKKYQEVILEPNDFVGPSNNVIVVLLENFIKMQKLGVEKQRKNRPRVILSHDIDSKRSYEKGIHILSEVLRQRKIVGSWFFVPKSNRYNLEKSICKELSDDMHEIGIHGYNHDGMLHRISLKSMKDRINKSLQVFRSFNINTTLFRSPFMFRSETLKKVLADEGFTIDSSYPDKDTLGLTRPLPGVEFNRPFFSMSKDNHGNILMSDLLEMPSSYPQDTQIISDYALSKDEVFSYWKNKFDFVSDFGGVFIFHGHPARLANDIEIYEDLISYFQKNKAEITTFGKIYQEYKKNLN